MIGTKSSTKNLTLGLDVGGTKLAGVLMSADGTIVSKKARFTHGEEGGRAVLQRLIDLALGLLNEVNDETVGVGVATPGIVDTVHGTIRFITTELPGWSDLPIAHEISQQLNLPVLVDNDGRAAALAEHRLGAGRGFDNFVALVLGTGVGGGIIANNELIRGAYGGGGRLGHISVDPSGPVCTCGNHGCLELYTSGPALAKAAECALAGGEKSQFSKPVGSGTQRVLSGREIVEAALAGDTLAQDVVRSAGHRLGQAIVQLKRILDPGRIAIGGSISMAGNLILDPAREHLKKHQPQPFQTSMDIVQAEFGRDASVVGAALLGWEAYQGSVI